MIDLKISKKKKIENFIFIEVFMDESEKWDSNSERGETISFNYHSYIKTG